MDSTLSLLNRNQELFDEDIQKANSELLQIISSSEFLIIGAAGTIGKAVTKEIFKRNPKKLHAVDISENNLVELVRDIRSSFGYIDGEFKTYALDINSIQYEAFIESDGIYDYVLNLSALKHVRSEKDPFTLMRMIEVNILNTINTIKHATKTNVKKYFCVSTDKATNPVNMMGASKRIMEMFLMRSSLELNISTARFANVAFSDGSLLHSFNQRLQNNQPIVAPNDIKRYFVTPKESGELCLLSCIFGENRDIFFPKLDDSLHLITFSEIAKRYLSQQGYEPYLCSSEDEARELIHTLPTKKQWPCLFSSSDTTGEKDFEEFFTNKEALDLNKFSSVGIIKNKPIFDSKKLDKFISNINHLRASKSWSKTEILNEFLTLLPEFSHNELGKYLDDKM